MFAAGGPAPITGAPTRLHHHRAQLEGLDELRAAAYMVYAWALLEGTGGSRLEEGERIAERASVYDSSRWVGRGDGEFDRAL